MGSDRFRQHLVTGPLSQDNGNVLEVQGPHAHSTVSMTSPSSKAQTPLQAQLRGREAPRYIGHGKHDNKTLECVPTAPPPPHAHSGLAQQRLNEWRVSQAIEGEAGVKLACPESHHIVRVVVVQFLLLLQEFFVYPLEQRPQRQQQEEKRAHAHHHQYSGDDRAQDRAGVAILQVVARMTTVVLPEKNPLPSLHVPNRLFERVGVQAARAKR